MTVKSKLMFIIRFIHRIINCLYSRFRQNSYNMDNVINAKKIIVFLVPKLAKINGGVLSIYNLCKTSREINPDALCILVTVPGFYTYYKNNFFKNNEKIYRFHQLTHYAKNLEECILHIPEYAADNFYDEITEQDIKFFKNIKNLHINIMNQNIEAMPEPEKLQNLYLLTKNITQTTAHIKYTTQEICNRWRIPTHLFSTYIDYSEYKAIPFEKKEKIIVLSPDNNKFKNEIVNKLKKEFKSWKFITVNNMTFTQYMTLIAKAYFVITFGEGMDGYYSQPHFVQTRSFAVFNDEFFPDKSWKELDSIYETYNDMLENIVSDMKRMLQDQTLYYSSISSSYNKYREMKKSLDIEVYKDNLRRFYNKQYDYYPQEK